MHPHARSPWRPFREVAARAALLALLIAGAAIACAVLSIAIVSAAPEESAPGDAAVAVDADDAERAGDLATLREQIRDLQERLQRLDDEAAAEIEALKRRIRELESQIESPAAPPVRTSDTDDDLEALREAARAEVPQEIPEEQEAEAQRESMIGRQRSQQALNPEISFLGDVSYDWSDSDLQDQFVLRGVEIGFQAPLDPYTRFKGFLAAHQHAPELEIGGGPDHGDDIEVELEEAYIDWVALPGGMSVRAGKFRQRFGTLNRWHEHALPSTDVPFALRNLFGHEGLEGIGVGAAWTLPGLWATSHGLTIEITNPDNDTAFAGAEFDDPAYLLRHTGFYDLGADAYLEIGLTGLLGPNDALSNGKTTIGSIDVNYLWEPAASGRYRGFEFRGEYFFSKFEDAVTPGAEETYRTDSLYAYLVCKLNRQWQAGLRYDDAELPSPRTDLASGMFREGLRENGYTTFLSYWQSEYVRLRLQYQHAERDFTAAQGPDDDDRIWLQVTFAAGPHKHEAY